MAKRVISGVGEMKKWLDHIRKQHAQTGEGVSVAEVSEALGKCESSTRKFMQREGWRCVGFRPSVRMDNRACQIPVYAPKEE